MQATRDTGLRVQRDGFRAPVRVKRNGFRVTVGADVDVHATWEVDCKSVPRARRFEAFFSLWCVLAPELPTERLIERAVFAAKHPEQLRQKALFWREAETEWAARQVWERAQLDLECALRFRARRKRARRM